MANTIKAAFIQHQCSASIDDNKQALEKAIQQATKKG